MLGSTRANIKYKINPIPTLMMVPYIQKKRIIVEFIPIDFEIPPQTPAKTLSSLILTKRFKAVYITAFIFKVRQAIQICKEK